jgi:hypothetical protein
VTNPSKVKGSRFENECVRELADYGIYAKKVPLSGSLGGEYSHDLNLPESGKTVECKHYKRWLAKFYGWLAKGPNYLLCKEDRGGILVVMTLAEFAELCRKAPK